MSGDLGLFIAQLFRKPHQVVALAPSSRALSAEMAATLDPSGGPVIELGAGTGRITRAILDRGIPADQVHSVEMNPDFCDKLRTDFPGLNVYRMSAGDVGALEVTGAQAVVSGLPLLSMPFDLQNAILRGSFAQVGAAGSYIQFTYGPKPPVKAEIREAMGLTWTTSRKVWGNLPPARVYRFTCPGA
ncbi:methyltransferase type 12 [Rhodobacteraceae bacterium W635]|uniref:class I SAM-dependent methyltransferase n=1 Tax=Nioella halotolerans TaxID=2303578 RepID=UPI000E3BFE3F|nr:methyltransferase type 12 [Rhodobacteraceae bacterium W635]